MFSPSQDLQGNETDLHSLSYALDISQLSFRCALVIEEEETLRLSIVQHLKKRGWIVHGIRRAKQALPLLGRIPYHLIVVDSNSIDVDAIEFARMPCSRPSRASCRVIPMMPALFVV